MPKNKNDFDLENVEFKMPEENFLDTDETTHKIPFMPLILFATVLILIGILGALLWWGTEILNAPQPAPEITATRPSVEENNEPESENAEADVENIKAMSTSDEIYAIEADLTATNIDNLDAEITALEAIVNK